MVTYVVLMKMTEKGVREMESTPKNAKAAAKAIEAAGGKLKAFYLTMGQYDFVAIVEAPKEEALLAQWAALTMGGNVSTESLKAFTMEEVENIL